MMSFRSKFGDRRFATYTSPSDRPEVVFVRNGMATQERGSSRKPSLLPSERTWNQSSQPQVKSLDYTTLLNDLSETVPGSQRKLTKKPSFLAFHSEPATPTGTLSEARGVSGTTGITATSSAPDSGNRSVLHSEAAKPRADHDLRVLQRLKSGELEPESYDQYRKSLVREKKKKNSLLQSAVDFTKPRTQTRIGMIRNGEMMNSPLNPERPGNHIAMMEKLRKLKYEVDGDRAGGVEDGGGDRRMESFESFQDDEWSEKSNDDNLPQFTDGGENIPVNLEESIETTPLAPPPRPPHQQHQPESPSELPLLIINTNSSSKSYLLDPQTPSPFLDSDGQPLPTKKFVQPSNHFMTPLQKHNSSSHKHTTSASAPLMNQTKMIPEKKIKLKKKPKRSSQKKATSLERHPQLSAAAVIKQAQNVHAQGAHDNGPDPFLSQKFLSQSAGLDVLNGLDSSQEECKNTMSNSNAQASHPSLEELISDAMLFEQLPQSTLKSTTATGRSKKSKRPQASGSKSYQFLDHLSPKFSREYYELCSLQLQPDSEISWNRIKKQERQLKKKQKIQQQLQEQQQQQQKAQEDEEDRQLLSVTGLESSFPNLDSVSGGDLEDTSDYTIQEFIGLEISSQQRPTTSTRPKRSHPIPSSCPPPQTSSEYLLQASGRRSTPLSPPPPADQPTFRIDRDGLLAPQDLETLSQAPSQSIDSQSGLLSADGLMNLKLSVTDPLLLLSSSSSPQDIIAKCIGRLLFADPASTTSRSRDVRIRPASAGIGGISQPKIYSSIINGVRPLSGGGKHLIPTTPGVASVPKAVSAGGRRGEGRVDCHTLPLDGKLFAHETKRRNVIERSLPADRWLA
jgi:hypothetical protein